MREVTSPALAARGQRAIVVGPRRFKPDYADELENERNRPYFAVTIARVMQKLRRIMAEGWR